MATALELRERLNAIPRDATKESWRVRIHRSLSWLRRAEAEVKDLDARFIFLWIALNAAYAREIGQDETERDRLREFFSRLVSVDHGGQIHSALFETFSGPVRTLIENRHVYQPFWTSLQRGEGEKGWRPGFEAARRAAMHALVERNTAKVLSIVFDRLYVLRNQLIHGGATWNSSVNRQQVCDGAAVLGNLVPKIVELMLLHPENDHGEILYPVIDM
jgi:hypothetical protein